MCVARLEFLIHSSLFVQVMEVRLASVVVAMDSKEVMDSKEGMDNKVLREVMEAKVEDMDSKVLRGVMEAKEVPMGKNER